MKTFLSIAAIVVLSPTLAFMLPSEPSVRVQFIPVAPRLEYSQWRTGPIEVAKVFGRSQGCQEADIGLIQEVSTAANRAGLDPRLVAAEVAVESGCNPMAISQRGAVGLLQVHVKTWHQKYDFATDNLFNTRTNLRVGTQVLAGYIKTYGVHEGVHHYNGMGIGCETCPEGYSDRVLALAGRK